MAQIIRKLTDACTYFTRAGSGHRRRPPQSILDRRSFSL